MSDKSIRLQRITLMLQDRKLPSCLVQCMHFQGWKKSVIVGILIQVFKNWVWLQL